MKIHPALILPFLAHPKLALALDYRNGLYRRPGRLWTDAGDIAGLTHTQSGDCWEIDADGELVPFSSNEPRVVPGLGLWCRGTFTNKCANYNASPVDMTGVTKAGDAAAILSVVDDSAALSAAGLPMAGNVYKLDNSAGSSAAWVNIQGAAGNTNIHQFSAFIRGGSGYIKDNWSGTPTTEAGGLFGASSSYRRVNRSYAAGNAGAQMQVVTYPGQVIYFILNQMVEGPQIGPIIPTAGSTASNGAVLHRVPHSRPDEECTLLVAFNMAEATPAIGYLAMFSDASSYNVLGLYHASTGVISVYGRYNLSVPLVDAGVTAYSTSNAVLNGRGVAAMRYRAGRISVALLDSSGAVQITPDGGEIVRWPIGMDRLAIGSANSGAQPLNGVIEAVEVHRGRHHDNTWLVAQLERLAA